MHCCELTNRDSGGLDISALKDECLEAFDNAFRFGRTPSTIGVFPPVNPLGSVA